MIIDIAAMPVGQKPAGFSEALTGQGAAVRWQVLEDQSAPNGKVIAETSRDTADYRFPLCIRDDVTARDIAVSVHFKAVAGEVDQAAGLVVRALDDRTYYVARANALEANVRLYKVTDGVRRQIAGHNVDVPSGVWQSLRLEAAGDTLTVGFNDNRVIQIQDSTITEAGKVGLWTKADSLTHFADLQISPSLTGMTRGGHV